jgi:iron-sulfur cluster repair protein YtfE (RIC family)
MIKEFFEKNDETLDLYTKAITRAHGKNHPEVFEVRNLYQKIQDKVRGGNYDLAGEFARLRAIAGNYAIPGDVCGTFRATYGLLSEFDGLAQEESVR